MNKITKTVQLLIEEIENSKAPLIKYIATFFAILTVRNLLELYSSEAFMLTVRYQHYYFFNISLALALMVYLKNITKGSYGNVARLILLMHVLVITPPLVDLLISGGDGFKIGYLMPKTFSQYFVDFISFFGSYNYFLYGFTKVSSRGLSPGLLVEMIVVLCFAFIYFRLKGVSIAKTFLATFGLYLILFLYATFPHAVGLIHSIFFRVVPADDYWLTNFFLITILILAGIVFTQERKSYFKEIVKDLRFFRVLHYVLMFTWGALINYSTRLEFFKGIAITPLPIFHFILISSAILFACIFSAISNNLEDIEIDKVSNPSRPSLTQSIPLDVYKRLSWAFLGLSMICAYTVNIRVLFFICLWIGIYYIYSNPPLRLKRVPFLSKFLIGLNSLCMVILGHSFLSENFFVPTGFVLLVLIGFSLVINFIDIKDYEGDKKAGIVTLPTLLGVEKAKAIIAILFLAVYPLPALIFGNGIAIIPLALLGALQYFYIRRVDYSEKPIFIIYFLTMIIFFVLTVTV